MFDSIALRSIVLFSSGSFRAENPVRFASLSVLQKAILWSSFGFSNYFNFGISVYLSNWFDNLWHLYYGIVNNVVIPLLRANDNYHTKIWNRVLHWSRCSTKSCTIQWQPDCFCALSLAKLREGFRFLVSALILEAMSSAVEDVWAVWLCFRFPYQSPLQIVQSRLRVFASLGIS